MLEKDREQLDEKSRNLRFQGEKSSRFASDLTNSNKDDFKRAKKIKRDHRRTRVIRTTPLEEEENQASFSSIAEQSPLANLSGCNESSCATPGDDRVKDPDWGQTPLRIKTSKVQKTILKRKTSTGNLRKTRSNSRLLSTADIEINNDENKV
jgi:hypothetical protein